MVIMTLKDAGDSATQEIREFDSYKSALSWLEYALNDETIDTENNYIYFNEVKR